MAVFWAAKLFQFQYGAIKGYTGARYSDAINNFNSSMVRLKESEQ